MNIYKFILFFTLITNTLLGVELSLEEKKFLQKNQTIILGADASWFPFDFRDEKGIHKGFDADYLKLLNKKLGINIRVETGIWAELQEKVKNKQLAGLVGPSKTPQRDEYMLFTQSYFSLAEVILVKKDRLTLNSLDDLNGKKLGIKKGSSNIEFIKTNFPKINIILFDSEAQSIRATSFGEIDGSLSNIGAASVEIEKAFISNLKIGIDIKELGSDMRFGIRNDWPELVSILQKGIDEITQEDIKSLSDKWLISDTNNYELFIKVGIGLIILILVIIYYNRRLKQVVNEKTSELTILLKSFDKNVIASRTDLNGRIIYASDAFCKISGYTKEELIGKSHNIVRHTDMPKEIYIELWNTIKSNNVWKGEIKNRKKDGGFYWTEAIISPEYDSKGKVVSYSAIRQDITAKKEVEELTFSLEEKVKLRTIDLENEKKFVNSVMNSQTSIVIATDGITLKIANKAFLDFYKIDNIEEFKEKFGNCICDTFIISNNDEYLQKITKGKKWIEYVYDNQNLVHKAKILKDNQEHIFSISADKFEFNGDILLTAVFTDITELEKTREEVEKILANILLPVLITSKEKRKILYANKYAEIQYEKPVEKIVGSDIDDIYTIEGQHYHIIEAIKNFGKVENMEESFKTATGKEFIALLSVTPIIYNNEESYIGMVTDITKQKAMENEIRAIHKHTKESIEYAALIQHSLIPSNDLFRNYFSDYLTIWHPKDIVGGDMYLFEGLRSDDECLLMVIDCTGHGVPGAFVTMLVKAIERQIKGYILNNPNEDISPAKMLSIFNKNIKHLLQQEEDTAISNVGFDGGILYYNKAKKNIKYAGAQTALFYIKDNELKTIKGDRHSVGYKKSDKNFVFTEHELSVNEGMNIFITTDGYLDQNGGEKGYPFGKKRFENILLEHKDESFADIQEILIDSLDIYQGNEDRNDDITVIGLKI